MNELCKCNDYGLFQAVHTFPDSELDVAVGFDGEVTLVITSCGIKEACTRMYFKYAMGVPS